jgi:hypothetical protein
VVHEGRRWQGAAEAMGRRMRGAASAGVRGGGEEENKNIDWFCRPKMRGV